MAQEQKDKKDQLAKLPKLILDAEGHFVGVKFEDPVEAAKFEQAVLAAVVAELRKRIKHGGSHEKANRGRKTSH